MKHYKLDREPRSNVILTAGYNAKAGIIEVRLRDGLVKQAKLDPEEFKKFAAVIEDPKQSADKYFATNLRTLAWQIKK